MPGRSLLSIASEADDLNRPIFSEYHAAGAISGCFMWREGRYKLIHYAGMEPQLFDLENDPDELSDLAAVPPPVWRPALSKLVRISWTRY